MTAHIDAEEIFIGTGAIVHPSARITGPDGGRAKRIMIGDHAYIGENVQIRCPEFSIGDYSKLHHSSTAHGYLPCSIGHNAWIGQFTILDSVGGLEIGNNCGIGAHSQLWSHIKYGDTLEGCRFLSEKALKIGNDVWFVGHCIVSPITAADKSMAMVGSVVTKDMDANTIYAGSPAKEISSRVGPQFEPRSSEEKVQRMRALVKEFGASDAEFEIVTAYPDDPDPGKTYFNISDRSYSKTGREREVSFMKFLLPEKAKFVPRT